MSTVSPTQIANGASITSSGVNTPINQLAATINGNLDDTNISSLSGTKISAGTLPVAAMTTDSNPETRLTETAFDFVASGCVWSGDAYGSTLNASMTTGGATANVVYIGGKRVVVSNVTARAFTASKDTYIDVDNTGTITYTEVANNAASPALAAGRIRLGIIVTGATNIANVGSVNQGQEDKVLPIASSIAYSVTDSLGNLICPRDPSRKVIGFRQITSSATTTATAATQVVGLSVPVIVPTGRKVRLSFYSRNVASTAAAGSFVLLGIWDGAVTSGTIVSEVANGVSYSGSVYFGRTYTPSAGSHTFNASFYSSAAGTATIQALGANLPAYLMVELV